MKLSLYHKKRNFSKTPEPKGKIEKKHKNLFVIQKHAASHLHYDFRLELNGVLLSWAVPKGPCLDPTVKRLAMHVEDHPVEYGHFEGVIPQGQYGAGTVMLWDKGTWQSLDDNPTKAYYEGHLRFTLKAKKLNGRFSLIKLKKTDDKSWFLIKGKDEFARPLSKFDITTAEPNSVTTNQSLDEIALNYSHLWTKEGLKKSRKKIASKNQSKIKNIKLKLPRASMPKVVVPQLATAVTTPPFGNDWLHELKFDGYRIIAFKNKNKIRLMSRNNRDWTPYFKNVVYELKKLNFDNAIFDGEIVLLDQNQQSNFQLLQNAIDQNKDSPFVYYIFDLIYFDRYDLRKLSLLERKKILHKIITSSEDPILRWSDYIIGSGPEIFKKSCEMALEGIVSKNIDSTYEGKRSQSWLKIKCLQKQEFLIGGYTHPRGKRSFFGSLFLGFYNAKKELVYCGNVGTGFNEQSLKTIYQQLQKNINKTNPFNSKPPGHKTAIWVKPKIIVEVEFTEWTQDGILRHPSFKGLRVDKKPEQITIEREVSLDSVSLQKRPPSFTKKIALPFKLTHPNKILYPEDKITKTDLVNYYDKIQKWILPFLINRPLTLVRCPENYKECFYQKHITESMPKALLGVPIKTKNKTEKYIYLKDINGLLALVQLGALEIHPWGSRIENIENPDMITFDLDPAPDVPWKKVVASALLVKEYLAELKLKSFVKTTGGKGLHVVIPIKPEYDWTMIKKFSHEFVKLFSQLYPGEYITEASKTKRVGKIFIDYLRNTRGATAVSAYSTRARAHAPVATPLDWDELTRDPRDTFYTIFTLPDRLEKLKKDPWKDFFKLKQKLIT